MFQAGQSACLPAFRGNAHAGERRGHQSDSSAARSCVNYDHGNLHTTWQSGRLRRFTATRIREDRISCGDQGDGLSIQSCDFRSRSSRASASVEKVLVTVQIFRIQARGGIFRHSGSPGPCVRIKIVVQVPEYLVSSVVLFYSTPLHIGYVHSSQDDRMANYVKKERPRHCVRRSPKGEDEDGRFVQSWGGLHFFRCLE